MKRKKNSQLPQSRTQEEEKTNLLSHNTGNLWNMFVFFLILLILNRSDIRFFFLFFLHSHSLLLIGRVLFFFLPFYCTKVFWAISLLHFIQISGLNASGSFSARLFYPQCHILTLVVYNKFSPQDFSPSFPFHLSHNSHKSHIVNVEFSSFFSLPFHFFSFEVLFFSVYALCLTLVSHLLVLAVNVNCFVFTFVCFNYWSDLGVCVCVWMPEFVSK